MEHGTHTERWIRSTVDAPDRGGPWRHVADGGDGVVEEPAGEQPDASSDAFSFSLVEYLRDHPIPEDRLCRLLNIAVAVVGLVALSPLFLLIAAAIKITSPGPVFYSQDRVGVDRRRSGRDAAHHRRTVDLGGRVFTIYKFRTMTVTDEAGQKQIWASEVDRRITPVGGILRKLRLDELPQLVNVLRGDMNVVGPRPEQPAIFQELRKSIPGYPVRQRVLPGITGWAQINNGYDQSLEDVERKVSLDIEYIEGRSALRDVTIMARTVPVMLLRRGAL